MTYNCQKLLAKKGLKSVLFLVEEMYFRYCAMYIIFIPLVLTKIPMKPLETYTISLGAHQNSYETVTSTQPLVFNYFLITFVLRVPFMTKTEIEGYHSFRGRLKLEIIIFFLLTKL